MESALERNNLIKNLVNLAVMVSFILGFINFFAKEDYFGSIVYILITPALLLMPRFFYSKVWRNYYKISLLNMLEFFAVLIFISSSLGTWWLYSAGFEYDTFAHFIVSLLIPIVLSFFLEIYNGESNQNDKVFRIAATVFCATALLGIFWELFEYGADKLIATTMFFGFEQSIFADTTTDIVSDILGAFAGSAIVFYKWPKWQKEWGSGDKDIMAIEGSPIAEIKKLRA